MAAPTKNRHWNKSAFEFSTLIVIIVIALATIANTANLECSSYDSCSNTNVTCYNPDCSTVYCSGYQSCDKCLVIDGDWLVYLNGAMSGMESTRAYGWYAICHGFFHVLLQKCGKLVKNGFVEVLILVIIFKICR